MLQPALPVAGVSGLGQPCSAARAKLSTSAAHVLQAALEAGGCTGRGAVHLMSDLQKTVPGVSGNQPHCSVHLVVQLAASR